MSIKITPTPISIKLVHADPWKELLKHAWMTSRPNITEDEMNNHEEYLKILKIDTPVSEIPGVVVELYIPMIFREIFTSMRDHIMWAQTSRVLNLTEEWHIVDKMSSIYMKDVEKLASDLIDDMNSGLPQDTYRRHLPLGYMSGMTCRFSLRTLFKLIKYFEYLNNNFDDLKYAAQDVCDQLAKIAQDVVGLGVYDVINTIKFLDIIPEFKVDNEDASFVNGLLNGVDGDEGNSSTANHTTITVNIPLSLRAQLIRHRTISVVDSLLDLMKMDGVFAIPHSTNMVVEVSANNNVWESIISKRNCWIAQVDLWKPIIDKVNIYLKSDELKLPCNNGICPYAGDCVERLKGTDPGVPCPRHALIMDGTDGLEVVDYIGSHYDLIKMVDETRKYVRDTGRDAHFWDGQITAFDAHMRS